jgi:hypothetical protein
MNELEKQFMYEYHKELDSRDPGCFVFLLIVVVFIIITLIYVY